MSFVNMAFLTHTSFRSCQKFSTIYSTGLFSCLSYPSLGFFASVCCTVNEGHILRCVTVLFVRSVSWVVLVRLSVPVQVTDWKDSSPK